MRTEIEIKFDAGQIPGGADAILGPAQCGSDVAKRKEYTINNYFEKRTGADVEITLDEKDPRVPKVFALLDEYGVQRWIDRFDIYTEDELQAAPLLIVRPWGGVDVTGGLIFGTKYDGSQGCQRCGTGAPQTSPLILDRDDLKKAEKRRLAFRGIGDVLVHDVDVEPLLAAGVTGALFWPTYAETKGIREELRWQQMFIEHVMPPMSPKSLLDRTQVCPECRRGCFLRVSFHSPRYVYRREDLANIQDVNLTWEWFGEPPSPGDAERLREALALAGVEAKPAGYKRWADPYVLVTPKVMNLLRGKTKKEQKYQGCKFIPIWVEDGDAVAVLSGAR